MRFTEFTLFEGFDPEVAELQRALKAAGADLGPFGPKKDGIDGLMGNYTRRAAEKFPEIAKKFPTAIAKSNVGRKFSDVRKLDTSIIQDVDFKNKLEKVANALGVKSNDLIAVMKQESGLDPQARHPQSGARGLIQFMPDTARMLGTTTDEIYKMDAVQQLDYVYKYFKMVGVGDGSLGDLYMAVFMPKYVGASDQTVLGRAGASGFSGKVYDQNKGLDRNRDGIITVADAKQSVARFA